MLPGATIRWFAVIGAFAFAQSASAFDLDAFVDKSATTKAITTQTVYDPPLVDWVAAQFLDMTPGMSVSPSLGTNGSSRVQGKTLAFAMASFIPITPCRLVDTRGVFNPVYGGPSFSAGQVR